MERKKEYKSFKFEIEEKDLKEDGSFEGYASVFNNVDSYNDIILPGAFTKTLRGDKQKPLFYLHDPNQPIGIGELSTDDHGLIVIGKFNLAVINAVKKYELLKQGVLKGLSIGFSTIKHEFEKRKDVMIRLLKELKLYEISLLPKGYAANQLAFVTNVKSLGNNELIELIESKKDDIEFVNKLMALFTEPEKSTPDEKSPESNDKPTYDHLLKFNENLIKLQESIKEV